MIGEIIASYYQKRNFDSLFNRPKCSCLFQHRKFFVGDPGVLDGIGRVGVAELSLNRGDIAGFLDEVPVHGVAGVMGGDKKLEGI
jgi:hypothetical protein